jgi:hypothetical protein
MPNLEMVKFIDKMTSVSLNEMNVKFETFLVRGIAMLIKMVDPCKEQHLA